MVTVSVISVVVGDGGGGVCICCGDNDGANDCDGDDDSVGDFYSHGGDQDQQEENFFASAIQNFLTPGPSYSKDDVFI